MTNKIDPKKLTPEALQRLKFLLPDDYAEIEASKHVNIWLNKFITTYDDMKQMKEDIRLLSETEDPVLIQGETGTGKELLANALHGERNEREPAGRFIAINCAGIPETLVESALFGHKGGAFTGATKEDRIGVFQAAHNGTVFLDEIGELSMSVQAKLLRALQEKKITKVGAEDKEAIDISCRFVAATHKDLSAQIQMGQFREDLYYRVTTFIINTRPLRDRSADIREIVKMLAAKDKNVRHAIKDVDAFIEPITAYIKQGGKLAGNVRQLEQLVRQYHVLGKLPNFPDIVKQSNAYVSL